MSLSSQLSLWNTGGGFNESFNSFLTGAVIELNSHRRAGSSTHHKPFPPIRDVTETAGREAGQSEIKKKKIKKEKKKLTLVSSFMETLSYLVSVSSGLLM